MIGYTKLEKSSTHANSTRPGFIIAIILFAILVIFVPKIAYFLRSANEQATRRRLQAMRSALTLYNAETGSYPENLTPMMAPGNKYLQGTLRVYTTDHGYLSHLNYSSAIDPQADSGSWGYVNAGSQMGTVWIQCTHTDLRGTAWTMY